MTRTGATTRSTWEDLRALLREDWGGRRLPLHAPAPDLEGLARALLGAPHVAILTGFPHVPTRLPETDGPLGAVALGEALASQGQDVTYVIDPLCRPALEALHGLPCLTLDAAPNRDDDDALVEQLVAALDHLDAAALVAIERPGRGEDGVARDMKGRPLGDLDHPLDVLLPLAADRGWLTVGLGDGGNEAGLGGLSPEVFAAAGVERPSAVPADHALVATSANGAALVLVAALGRVAGADLLPDLARLDGWHADLEDAGCVDGVTGARGVETVDGVEVERTRDLLRRLRAWVGLDP